ncbi:glucose 1-dehydrogenase [Alteromonas sp. ASW11-36]|uniref:Glucose 1-dehydrogenase n=1 Tax=Alteromonas arenosi TaxID=3055817 RepID=A0ABT7SVE1_9ALTE|nr:glucose 1-dehydrogenase [Alteromonas sp. ASW11-36]MDM7860146.1 glucose 1-dehydrogenase [Alteromonas sp. ASW11-36]
MLEQKVILITGANRGIGLTIAQVCTRLGAIVLLAGRNDAQLEIIAEQLGENAIPMAYDIADEEQVKAAFGHIKQHIGRLDGLVNNAGAMQSAPVGMTRIADLRAQLDVNTVATFQHAQLATRLMAKQQSGAIVNLCSIIGEQGSAGQAAYATSKAAVSGMTKAMAKEFAPLGVRINGVAPGFIDTDMTADFTAGQREEILANIGLGRMGNTQDVADLVSFLLSDHASYITGQIIGVDGGMRL